MMEPTYDVPGDRLAPWKHAVIGWVRSDWPDLTNRQLALLMVVCREKGPHPVRALAGRLGVPKPVISRVLDRLAALRLIEREIDRRDRRNVYAVATDEARRMLDDLDEHFASGGRQRLL